MLNHQTKKKIIDIKEDIVAGMDLKELDRKYFNTKRKKADFLTKNLQYFNQEELKYLDFKSIETLENEEKLIPNELAVSKLDNIKKEVPAVPALQLPEEFNYFKDKENLKKLIEIVEKYKNHVEVEIIEAGKIEIPLEVRNLKMDGNIAVKSNLAIYEELKELAYINKIGIGQVVTLAIWEFLKRHK